MSERHDDIIERVRSNTSRLIAGLAVTAVVAGYFAQPLLRFADPERLRAGLLMLVMGSTFVVACSNEDRIDRFGFWLGVASLALAAISFYLALHAAADHAHSNDRRCAAIQRDMLSSRPQRADGPDLFQALGCRPQGEGDVFAPRRGGRV